VLIDRSGDNLSFLAADIEMHARPGEQALKSLPVP
jgi:hypothetical protein